MPKLNFRNPAAGLFTRELAPWLRDLKKVSGVYVIRERDTNRVCYVGESHTDRLGETIARHFRAWTGKTAGPTYSRQFVDVAAIVTAPGAAVDLQNELIDELDPRDNTLNPIRTARNGNGRQDPF